MEVDERDAGTTVEVAILWPNREQQHRLLPVVAGRAAGCDVDKSCVQFIRDTVPRQQLICISSHCVSVANTVT